MPDVQPAENLNLGSVTTAPAMVANSLLHASHQPSDVMLIKLIMPPIRWRQPEANKPVATEVMQVTGQFLSNIFENRVFLNIL